MLFSRTSLLLALTTSLVAAAPYMNDGKAVEARAFNFWSGRKGHHFLPRSYQQTDGQCNLGTSQLPQAPKPLPPPSPGLSLYHVAVGRGTQNYTCDLSNSTAVPVAIGALASLFNVTCLTSVAPTLLAKIPAIALELPTPPANNNANSPITQALSGHHYFTDMTTPYFNLNTDLVSYGAGAFKKLNATDAPADASIGQGGKGYGAVSWLKLGAKDPSSCKFTEIYRVNTAGGQPPKSCSGQQASFQIQYSAEYWMYA